MQSVCKSMHNQCSFMPFICKPMLCKTMLACSMCKSMHWLRCKFMHWLCHP